MRIKNWKKLSDGVWFNKFTKENVIIVREYGYYVVLAGNGADLQSFDNYVITYEEAKNIAISYMRRHENDN
jgi:hypothetical protein